MIDAEKATMDDIVAAIPSQIPVYSAIGATTFETATWWTQSIELGITPLSGGMIYSSWIGNKVSLVHAPSLNISYFHNQVTTSDFRENLNPSITIPTEYVTDIPNSDNYEVDWKYVYDELVKVLAMVHQN
jgi:hypothetical protein